MTVTKVELVDLSDQGSASEAEAVEAFVKTCTPSGSAQPWEMSTFDFVARCRATATRPPSTLISGVREPSYPDFTDLAPGRCREGWIQIVMGGGVAKKMRIIEFQVPQGTLIASWGIPRGLTLGQPDY